MPKLLTFEDITRIKGEQPVYIETKQTLRPAFCYGMIERPWLRENTYAVHLQTPAKLIKHWEWRLYNRTWRLWDQKPSRDERAEVKWDA